MSADPVSWLVIERGWAVVDPSGEQIGRVHAVVGDPERDIFTGVAVARGVLGRPRFVPAERVVEIVEGRVRVDLRADEVDALDVHEAGAGEE